MEDAAASAAPTASATAAQDTCFGAGSVAGAVIGTFLTTILLLAVAAFLYRQWRRRKTSGEKRVIAPNFIFLTTKVAQFLIRDRTPFRRQALRDTVGLPPGGLV
ncbi:hypothetical protein G5I_08176 [Acromyrmex echinatior]|uniref:Uncharacterized protein n=1 Tax=Acromyrmex echinatior TaxID=103372 RepID=F4WQT5_ACREC|nr:hypothetical protein G5I_08176 [Acromyrmex echinatior]